MRQASRAVVIGASISGLLSARVLSEVFDEVLVVERDCLENEGLPKQRKGIPQAPHQHLLLLKGRQLLESYFPGFDQELAALGAPLVNYSKDVSLWVGPGKLPRFDSEIEVRACRRQLLDFVLLKRCRNIPNLHIIDAHRVTGLLLSEDRSRVQGIKAKEMGVPAFGDCQFEANLVLDCSGRGSHMPRWLSEQGLGEVESVRVNPKLAYASRLYRRLPGKKITAMEVAPHAPDQPRAMGFWPVENDQWLLTLIGTNGIYPSHDEAQFLEFAKALPGNVIGQLLENLEPVSEIQQFRGTENQWFRYDKMSDHPSGLIVMGDAMCAFNPLYGQGVSLIASAVEQLGSALRGGVRSGFSRSWVRKQYRRNNRLFWSAWLFAVIEDLRWPSTRGLKKRWYMHLASAYFDFLMRACMHSKRLSGRCLLVANLVRSPLLLVRPDTILLALWHAFRSPPYQDPLYASKSEY